MIDPNKTEIIIAGPGVGKTTELLNRIEQALTEGVQPLEIAFFSFSNTAVNEGLERITKRLNYSKNQFRYFRTLHSMAFMLLGLNANQIITNSMMNKFAKANDLKLSAMDYRTGVIKYQTKDSIMLSQIESARLLGLTVREYFVKNHIDDEDIKRAEKIADRYAKYKIANGIIDFTDMILLANSSENIETPHFKYMFIDEAQDLSTQQWKFVERLSQNADNIIVVGDERQAIAEFAGADVDMFLSLQGKQSVLNQSYRIPKNIYKLAHKVEKYMKKTRGAEWKPRPMMFGEKVPGEVIRITELPIREMAHGKWLLLTRTNSQLTDLKDYIMQYSNVFPAFFTIDGQPPINTEIFQAIQIFEIMKQTDRVTKYDFIRIEPDDPPEKVKVKRNFITLFKKFMSCKNKFNHDLDSLFLQRFSYREWYEAFDKIPLVERNYIRRIHQAYLKNPNAFNEAKIKLSTIHSSKGTEADNVILYTVLTGKVYHEWQTYKDTNDTEAKVLFVGITRAKKRLYLLGKDTAQYSYKEMLD